MKIVMKLKKQHEVASLSKLMSQLHMKATPSPELFRDEIMKAIKNDDGVKLLELLKTPNHVINSVFWNEELYFTMGKYVSSSSYDILCMFPSFSKHIGNYMNDIFEGIASGDNDGLLAFILERIDYTIIASKLELFMDTHAMRCFKRAFNFVCKAATIIEFKVIIRHLLNRNISTLNTDAITTMQHCMSIERQF